MGTRNDKAGGKFDPPEQDRSLFRKRITKALLMTAGLVLSVVAASGLRALSAIEPSGSAQHASSPTGTGGQPRLFPPPGVQARASA